uniref:Uncharacterized protein n=1 Tax=Podarcis muralis TaxID=64176 RepID=A0A670KE11_PODMU
MVLEPHHKYFCPGLHSLRKLLPLILQAGAQAKTHNLPPTSLHGMDAEEEEEDPMRGLQKAALCSICLEYFQDPVSIDCGHNFCQACIAQCCDDARTRFSCPHCRRRSCKKDFRPNRELAEMVEIAKRFKRRRLGRIQPLGLSLPTHGIPNSHRKMLVASLNFLFLSSLFTASVTLDPGTAGPYLILSDDGKSVWLGDTRQKRPTSRGRFNLYPCVLGCEGFASGKHSWVVEVESGGSWAVGVAQESVKRKKKLNFRPEQGVWALEHLGANHYRALTSPPTPLPLRKAYRRIQVHLDYEAGQVAFFDAENEDLIFAFPSSRFAGDIIHPWMWVGLRSRLRLCP